MAKKQPAPIFNDYKDDAYYGNMFNQHMNNSGYADDYNAYQTGQQAFQESQAEAQQNGFMPEGNDTVGNGVLGSLVDSAQAGFAGSLGGTSRFLAEFSPVGKDTFNSFADSMDKVVRNNTPLEKPEGANYVAGAIGNAIGSGGAALAEAAIVAGIGKVLGLGAVGAATLKVIQKTPVLGRLATATETMWKSGFGGKLMAGEVFGSPFEASAEAGNLITEMRNEGFSDDEIRSAALKSAAYNTAWLTVANVLEGKVGMAIGGAAKIGSKAGKVAMASVGDAAGEGMEEFGQNLIGNVAKGEDLDFEEAREAAIQGAIGGAFLGGGRQAIDSYLGNNPQEEAPVAQEDNSINKLRNGLNQGEAQPVEQPTPVVQEQGDNGSEAPAGGSAPEFNDAVPSLEVVDGVATEAPAPAETAPQDVQQPQAETPVQGAQPEQAPVQKPKPEKPAYVGSATEYKNRTWGSVEEAQADLDAIIEDIKQNGKKYSNLKDLKTALAKKLSDDLITKKTRRKDRRNPATLDKVIDNWYAKAKAARDEYKANPTKKQTPATTVKKTNNTTAATVTPTAEQVAQEKVDTPSTPVQNIEVKPQQQEQQVNVKPVSEAPQENVSSENKTEIKEAPVAESPVVEAPVVEAPQTPNKKTPLGFNSKVGEWETNAAASKDGSGEETDVVGKKKAVTGQRHYYKRADGSVGVIYHNNKSGEYSVTVNGKEGKFTTLAEAEKMLNDEPVKQAVASTPATPKEEPKPQKKKSNLPEKLGKNLQDEIPEDTYDEEFLKKNKIASLDDIGWYGPYNVYKHTDDSVTVEQVSETSEYPVAKKKFANMDEVEEFMDKGVSLADYNVDNMGFNEEVTEEDTNADSGVMNVELGEDKELAPAPKQEDKKEAAPKSVEVNKMVKSLGDLAKKCGVKMHFGDQELIDHLKTRADVKDAIPCPENIAKESPEVAGSIQVAYTDGTVAYMEGLSNPNTSEVWLPNSKLSVEATVHEFTHLWNNVIRQQNPVLWNKIVNVLEKTSKWKEIENDATYKLQHKGNRDEIADEVMAWLAGENAETRLKELETQGTSKDIIGKLKAALKAYWKEIKKYLHENLGVEIGDISLQELVDMPLIDLVDNRINVSEGGHSENARVTEILNNTQDAFDEYSDKGKRPLKTIINSLRQDVKPQFNKAYDELNAIVDEYKAQGNDFNIAEARKTINDKIKNIFSEKPFKDLYNAEEKFANHFKNELNKLEDTVNKAKEKAEADARKAEAAAKKKAEEEVKKKAKENGVSDELQEYIDEEYFGDSNSESIQFLKSSSDITGIEGLEDNASWFEVIEWAADKAEKQEYQKSLGKLGEAIKEHIEEDSDNYYTLDGYYEYLTGEEDGMPYYDAVEEEKPENNKTKKVSYIPLGENDAIDKIMTSVARNIKAGNNVDDVIEKFRNKLQDRENNPYKLSPEDAESALKQFDGVVAYAKQKFAEMQAKEAEAKVESQNVSDENKTEEVAELEVEAEADNRGPLSELQDPIEIADAIMEAEEGEITADDIRNAVANMDKDDRIAFFEALKGNLIENNIGNLDIENGKTADPDYPLTEQLNDMLSGIEDDIKDLGIPEEYTEWLTDITSRSPIWQNLKDNEGQSFDKDVVEFNVKKHKSLLVTKSSEKAKFVLGLKNIKAQASTQASQSAESKLAGAVTTNAPQTFKEKAANIRENPMKWLADWWEQIYIDWVDKNDKFKDIDKKHEKAIGRKLQQHEKLYGRAQGVYSSANGTSDVLIGGGREELAGLNKRLENTKLKHPNGTMKQVLENVKEDELNAASKQFMKKYGFKDSVEALGAALSWRRLKEMHHLIDNAHKQWQHEKDLMDKWQAKKDKFDKLREDAFRAIEDGKSVKIDGKVYTSKSAVGKALAVGPSPLAQHHTDWLEASRKWNSAHEKWRKAKKQAERHNQPFTTVDPSIAMKEAWKAKCKAERWQETTAEPSTKLAEEPKYELPNGLTIDELKAGVETIPEQFLNACDDYYAMNDNILCLLEDAGVISKDLHTLLNTTYKEYCPLQRDFSETEGLEDYLNGFAGGSGVANVSNMIKEISKDGSKKNIINPLQTTIGATMTAARRAERNRVGMRLTELAKIEGMENVIKKVDPVGYEKDGTPKYPAADVRYSTFTVMENGKKVLYQTSPEYYQAIVGYDPPASNIVWDSLSVFAQFLRTGATMTPSFIVRNGFRDSVLAGYMTNVGFKPIIGTINGIRKLHAKSGKEAERNAMFKAIGFGSMTRERDGEAIYNDLQKQVASDKIDFTNPFSLWNAFKDWFVGMNEDVELGTRRELFGLAMDKYEADFKAGKISYEDLLQMAAETGRFGTTDFTRSGIKGQQVNRVSAFFNANVQGVDLYIQGLKNPETRPRMLAFIGTYIALPCLAIWAANHDKDWWKELDPQVKYTNFCVSEYFRVPLPQEAGVMFGGGLMAILDMAMDNDPKSMGVWGHAVKESLCPNPIPTVLTPIMEWQANYSFFKGRPIVNQRLQKLPDDMQYDNYTTELSKLVGKVANLSPKKLDNTVKDIGATLGIQTWDVLGDALVMAMGQDKVRPDKDFREKVFVRDFNVTEGIRGRYTNDFYDLWSEANKLKSAGRVNRQQAGAVKSLNAAQRVISKLNKEIRAIGDPENTKLTSAQKQEMLAVRREKIKKVAKQATDKYGKYFES